MNRKRFTNIVLIILVLFLVGVLGYITLLKKSGPVQQSQTNNSQSTNNSGTENWQVYRSEKNGVEFKHPQGWYIWDGGDVGVSIYEYRVGPGLPGVSRSMQIYRHKNENVDVKTYAEQNTPSYSTESNADIGLLKKEQGYVNVGGVQAYQVYTKTIDRHGPMECYNPPCDWSAYKNVESLFVRTYIPHNGDVFSVSVNMSGERGSDEQKKKINLTEETGYLNTYKQILSTIRFLN